jgi:hypothetical protein
MKTAIFSHSIVEHNTKKVLCIFDQCVPGYGSVTNTMEAVLADLQALGYDLNAQPIIYCDSEGIWDGVIYLYGQFRGFVSINKRHQMDAIEAAYRYGLDKR